MATLYLRICKKCSSENKLEEKKVIKYLWFLSLCRSYRQLYRLSFSWFSRQHPKKKGKHQSRLTRTTKVGRNEAITARQNARIAVNLHAAFRDAYAFALIIWRRPFSLKLPEVITKQLLRVMSIRSTANR